MIMINDVDRIADDDTVESKKKTMKKERWRKRLGKNKSNRVRTIDAFSCVLVLVIVFLLFSYCNYLNDI